MIILEFTKCVSFQRIFFPRKCLTKRHKGSVVSKQINLIQDYRKLLFLVFNFLVKFLVLIFGVFKIELYCKLRFAEYKC